MVSEEREDTKTNLLPQEIAKIQPENTPPAPVELPKRNVDSPARQAADRDHLQEVPCEEESTATAAHPLSLESTAVAAAVNPLRGDASVPGSPKDHSQVEHDTIFEMDDPNDAQVIAESRRRTRRSFLFAGAAAVAAYGFYDWLDGGPKKDDISAFLDKTYDANAQVSRTLLDQQALTPTYSLSKAETLRVNGIYGLKRTLKPESYRLQVVGVKDAVHHPRFVPDVTKWEYKYADDDAPEDQGHDTKVDPAKEAAAHQEQSKDDDDEDDLHTGRKSRGEEESGESFSTLRPNTPGLLLTLDDFLPRMQRHDLVTQFKCIEGWSQIVHWAGFRLADFIALYPPALIDGKEPKYVYMETPDGDYYVGYDLAVCRHPQTLLVTEMMGAPLTQSHGAPLRIHMPTKYGYKQIKRVALIAYTNEKPDDYWTKLGYDWYGGL